MNENIGAKGGKRDRKRTAIISKKKKEKILKRIQLETFLKVIPITIIGETYKVITQPVIKKELPIKKINIEKNHQMKSFKIIEYSNKDNLKSIKIIYQKPSVDIKRMTQDKIEIKKATIIHNNDLNKKISNSQILFQDKNQPKKIDSTPMPVISKIFFPLTDENKKINNIISDENKKANNIISIKKKKQQPISDKRIKLIENAKIIELYQKRLKDIKYDFNKLSYEYKTLENELENTYTLKNAEIIITKLNIIIKKLEELKEKLKIEDIDKFDDAYIYKLVEEYMKEFDNKNIINDIKNSDLYILLSEKIENFDKEKDTLKNKINDKKNKLNIDEKKVEYLKEKYANFDNLNNKLIEFQYSQDKIIKNIQEKIKLSDNVYERVETRVSGMETQSNKLLKLLSFQMMIPGIRSAKAIATTTLTYLYFMKKGMKPKIEKTKYKIIKVTDYSKEIEHNLVELNNTLDLLNKTSNTLNRMITDFKNEYKDYLMVLPDCNKLLYNLEKVKYSLQDKEYELEKMKNYQKKNLKDNNSKVKKLNNKSIM